MYPLNIDKRFAMAAAVHWENIGLTPMITHYKLQRPFVHSYIAWNRIVPRVDGRNAADVIKQKEVDGIKGWLIIETILHSVGKSSPNGRAMWCLSRAYGCDYQDTMHIVHLWPIVLRTLIPNWAKAPLKIKHDENESNGPRTRPNGWVCAGKTQLHR